MSTLTNKAAVRRAALSIATNVRSHQFTRVAKEFLDAVEYNARAFITARINAHPSKGKTLQ